MGVAGIEQPGGSLPLARLGGLGAEHAARPRHRAGLAAQQRGGGFDAARLRRGCSRTWARGAANAATTITATIGTATASHM